MKTTKTKTMQKKTMKKKVMKSPVGRKMKRALAASLAAMLAITMMLVAGGQPAPAAPPPSTWEVVSTIPNADDGYRPARIWTGEPGVVYVQTTRTSPTHDTALLRWDGDWSVEVDLPGYANGTVFGTGPDDVYFGTYSCTQPGGSWSCPGGPDVVSSKLFHFDGVAWTEETLPAAAVNKRLDSIGGVPGEVHVGVGQFVIRNDGSGWTIVYDAGGGLTVSPRIMTFVGPDEGYMASCWGHAWWDGTTWTKKVEFDFCDVGDMWGVRDDDGELHLRVVGNNNFSNGLRVWKYDETARSFGSKYGFEFGDPPTHQGPLLGHAGGIWGAAWDDVYVVGSRWTAAHPYPTPPEDRIYHHDGADWTRLALPAELDGTIPLDVFGTGHDDVWFSFVDGRIAHLGVFDADGDGVLDGDDVCPGTEIPDPLIPTERLGMNRLALIDDDGAFDTRTPNGTGPDRTFTIDDTAGCNAGQIADALGLGPGHHKFGISASAMETWVALAGG